MRVAIIAVSFGTSADATREKTIGAVERDFAEKYPHCKVVRAFTSGIVIKRLKERGIKTANVPQALEALNNEGYERIIIQSLHVIKGEEYEKISSFTGLEVGQPLLADDIDLIKVADFFGKCFARDEDEAIVLMGHGSPHKANETYSKLEQIMQNKYNNIYIGTVEDGGSIDDIITKLGKHGSRRVVITPLMLVAGDHAVNDMAGDDDNSWKSRLQQKGFSVRVVMKGLGEYSEIRSIYLEHLAGVM
jgi:sirohydrochlorin cobaltochelatase